MRLHELTKRCLLLGMQHICTLKSAHMYMRLRPVACGECFANHSVLIGSLHVLASPSDQLLFVYMYLWWEIRSTYSRQYISSYIHESSNFPLLFLWSILFSPLCNHFNFFPFSNFFSSRKFFHLSYSFFLTSFLVFSFWLLTSSASLSKLRIQTIKKPIVINLKWN